MINIKLMENPYAKRTRRSEADSKVACFAIRVPMDY